MRAGVLKALVGLSASMYTSLYAASLKPDSVSFLLIIALAPTAAGLLAMTVFNAVPSAAAAGDDAEAACKSDKTTGACSMCMHACMHEHRATSMAAAVPAWLASGDTSQA
jgi:hypothetical protein